MSKEIERLTFMESRILKLGKQQYEKGYQGGSFTPGFIRKETEYGYRTINIALESLIAQELVEKTVTQTFRKGELVDLDVYKITNRGIATVARVDSGMVEVYGKTQAKPMPFAPESRENSRPHNGSNHIHGTQFPVAPELERTVRSLESAVRTMASDIKTLHAKLDDLLAREIIGTRNDSPQSKGMKSLSGTRAHRIMVLNAVGKLESPDRPVLAEDVKESYFAACSAEGLSPKGKNQFTTFLKRLEKEGLLSLKRVGCKNLGIKGQGSRVVVSLAPGGRKLMNQYK